jgi:hypothetical protein
VRRFKRVQKKLYKADLDKVAETQPIDGLVV